MSRLANTPTHPRRTRFTVEYILVHIYIGRWVLMRLHMSNFYIRRSKKGACVCIYIYIYIYILFVMYVCIYWFIYLFVCLFVYIFIYLYNYARLSGIDTHIYIYIYIYICIHVDIGFHMHVENVLFVCPRAYAWIVSQTCTNLNLANSYCDSYLSKLAFYSMTKFLIMYRFVHIYIYIHINK